MSISLRFLLAEQNPVEAATAHRTLEDACGGTVTLVADPSQALELLRAEEFDAAIVGHELRELDGLELIRRARAAGIKTPVIFVADAGKSLQACALHAGADAYVARGSDYAEALPALFEKVRAFRALQKRNDELKNAIVEASRLAAIGEVAAGIAHEIRNPMTVLLGMAQHLRDNADRISPDEIRNCADAILRNGRTLLRSLDAVLSGVSQSAEEQLDLRALLGETLAFMRFDPEFRHRVTAQIVSTNEQKTITVMGDRNALRQVFINLLRNAAQSIASSGKENGEARVELEEAGNSALIKIIDDGAGITHDALPRLFESGFSTKRGGRDETRGAGLGLSICRRIVEQHGGTIEGANRPDAGGAAFTVTLPLAP
jgi:signal transduction histidine kinase